MENREMTWAKFLQLHQGGHVPLFSEAFMRRWADERWTPNDDDRKAAGKAVEVLVQRDADSLHTSPELALSQHLI
jgi:hypothetical protein